MIIPVILSGGSGTRLWPLSTPGKPKQFLPLLSERTLFQETLTRLAGIPGVEEPIVACNETHGAIVAEQLHAIGVTARSIILEPAGRNTAPAIGVVANLFRSNDAILLVLPADHLISDAAAFRTAVGSAVAAAAAGRLVTFGVVPTHAETGYGYIEQGGDHGGWRDVVRFIEKPDQPAAEEYFSSGRYLWNSGMFVFHASTLNAELASCAPAISAACEKAAATARSVDGFTRLGSEFLDCPSDSIDYAVMERTDRAAVVPLDAGWSDVGSWAALYDALAEGAGSNVLRGDVETLDSQGNLVIGGARKIALLGVDDLVVVDAGDTVLILARNRSQSVKELKKKTEACIT